MKMLIGWPQGIFLLLVFTSLGISIAKHGEATKHNGTACAVSTAITLALLWWGGFFG